MYIIMCAQQTDTFSCLLVHGSALIEKGIKRKIALSFVKFVNNAMVFAKPVYTLINIVQPLA